MYKKFLKRSAMYLFTFGAIYLLIGNLLHRVIFPEKKPDISTYFKPGLEFYSKTEGFRQHFVKRENGFVHCRLDIEPFAAGPPKHIHDSLDETFEIQNGELTIWINGKIKKLRAGEVVLIPKGTPHKPYNETGDTIRLKGTIAFPEKFAFQLRQVYHYMDHAGFSKSPKTMFQMAIFQQAGFDSYIADGPPVFIQKLIGFVANPVTRLLGFKSYYENSDSPKNTSHRL